MSNVRNDCSSKEEENRPEVKPKGRKYPLQVLFWETRGNYGEEGNRPSPSISYTLKDHEHRGYPSLYQLYMTMEDTTEWEFANTYLENYEHWMRLCEASWFKPYIARWRHELQQKLKARALKKIKEVASADDKDSYAANKYLLTQLDPPEPPSARRGRPSKEQIDRETKKLAEEQKYFEEDFKRLRSTIVDKKKD